MNVNSAMSSSLWGMTQAQNKMSEAADMAVSDPLGSLPEAAVMMVQAKTAMAASAKVLQVVQQMDQAMLDILA